MLIVERTENPMWLSNAYLVADEGGGKGVLIDGNDELGPLLERAIPLVVEGARRPLALAAGGIGIATGAVVLLVNAVIALTGIAISLTDSRSRTRPVGGGLLACHWEYSRSGSA